MPNLFSSKASCRPKRGDMALKNADHVEFTIADSGKAVGKVSGQHEGGGVYSGKTMFREEGVYDIQAHAKAEGMKVMPIKQTVVGGVSAQEPEIVGRNGSKRGRASPLNEACQNLFTRWEKSGIVKRRYTYKLRRAHDHNGGLKNECRTNAVFSRC
nr:FixH family protein [Bacillus glycinifermentans]